MDVPLNSDPCHAPARSLASFALADTDASLDPENPINTLLRKRGVGLVPTVVATEDAARRAIVSAESILAQFSVPYGWHVIDDGRRALLFEPSGEVQINFNLLPREGRTDEQILDAIAAEARSSYPSPEFVRRPQGRLSALGVLGIQDGGQSLEQHHLLMPGRYDDQVLRARVTTTPGRSASACRLAERVLESMDFECFPHREPTAPARPDQPDWWHEARRLEAAGRLKEAEEAIRRGVNCLYFATCIADLYAERMVRLQAAGDTAGALAAYKAADEWNTFFAAQATSGGEGAALSEQRDRFRERLHKAYTSDFVPVSI